MPPAAKSTKEEILLAGERLIADHGVDGVSMRQIGAAIGSGNNSAVLYHFGSKEKLVEAIFEYRLPRLRERRAELVAGRRPAITSLVKAARGANRKRSATPCANRLAWS